MSFRSRPSWLLFLAAGLVLAASFSVQGGTEEAPEITDAAGDQAVLGEVDGVDEVGFAGSDLRAGWITDETVTEIHLFMKTSGTFVDGTAGPYSYEFRLTSGGTEYIATLASGTSPAPGGIATSVAISGGTADFTVPKTNIGSPAAGAVLSGICMAAYGGGPSQVPGGLLRDRAPDTGFGTDYILTGGFAPGGSAEDVDGDGLPDAWELTHFDSIEAQDGAGDPDGDGLNNTGEFAKGTDPNVADTDGDGANDADDPFPLDPTRGGPGSTASDTDGDGLNDTWEETQFGGIAAQNGTGDPDGDGLNNTAEQTAGTDPNVADTDGDGQPDGIDPAPLDATSGGGAGGLADRRELQAGAALFGATALLSIIGLSRRLVA